jgi:hypothetical protein
MPLIIGILKEREDKRVARTPDNIKRSNSRMQNGGLKAEPGGSRINDGMYSTSAKIVSRSAIPTSQCYCFHFPLQMMSWDPFTRMHY